MNISGIDSNYYLSDNPIFVELSDFETPTKVIEVRVKNLSTQINSSPLRYYLFDESITIDIAPLVKAMMQEPNLFAPYVQQSIGTVQRLQRNYVHLEFSFIEYTDPVHIVNLEKRTKTFIRGGKRTYQSNQKTNFGAILSPTEIIPIWPGFPKAYYYIGQVTNHPTQYTGIVYNSIIPQERTKTLKVKTCDSQYVVFLNSLGGYSHWLFENWETEESSDNIGSILGTRSITDLGNEYEKSIVLISKVPKQFLPLMKDLIVSKEIYLYDPADQSYTRINSDNNKIKENPFDVNYKVKLKFTQYSRYNPALIW